MHYQNAVNSATKQVQITRGFLFLAIHQTYSVNEVNVIKISEKTRAGTDSNGIGPTKRDSLITIYCVELVLNTGKTKTLTSSRDKNQMKQFAEQAQQIMECRLVT